VFLFQDDPEILARVRAQVTAPPDPRLLPWSPPPDYDPQTVAVRIRLDRAAQSRRPEAAPQVPQPSRVESAFAHQTEPVSAPLPRRGLFQLDEHPESRAVTEQREVPPTNPEEEAAPAGSGFVFGIAQGAYRRKKDAAEDKTKARPRRRAEDEGDLQERLKKRFL